MAARLPHENREVLVYDHFAGENSLLKFMIKSERRKKYLPLFNVTFSLGHYNIKKICTKNIKKNLGEIEILDL